MNVFELPMLSMVSSQASAGEPSPAGSAQDNDVDFAALLSGISGQPGCGNQATNPIAAALNAGKLAGASSRLNLSSQSLLAALGAGQMTDLPPGSELFAELGQSLLGLVSQLLSGGEATVDKDKLTSLLDGIVESLSKENDGATSGSLLIKLFAKAKEQVASGELEGQLGKLTEGLPEPLKLKIKLSVHRNAAQGGSEALGGQQMGFVHYKLVANLLGIANPDLNAGLAQGVLPEGLAGHLPANSQVSIVEKLMAKFGATEHGLGTQVPDNAKDSEVLEGLGANLAASTTDESVAEDSGLAKVPESVVDAKFRLTQRLRVVESVNQSIAAATDAAEQAQGIDSAAAAASLEVKNQPKETLDIAAKTITGDTGKSAERIIPQDMSADGFGTSGEGAEEATAGSTRGEQGAANPAQAAAAQGKPSFAAHISEASQAGVAQESAKQGPANPQNVLGQIVQKFDVLMGEGKTEAKLELKPKYLGDLKIHLVVENGSIKALLDASTNHAKELIEANLANLKQQLESQGLTVKEFDVSVGQQRGGQAQGNFAGSSRFGRGHFNQNQAQPENGKEISNSRVSYNLGGSRAVNYLA